MQNSLDLIGGAGEKPEGASDEGAVLVLCKRFEYTREILDSMSDDVLEAHYGDTLFDCGPGDELTRQLKREMSKRGLLKRKVGKLGLFKESAPVSNIIPFDRAKAVVPTDR
jgi:hypothetical protein